MRRIQVTGESRRGESIIVTFCFRAASPPSSPTNVTAPTLFSSFLSPLSSLPLPRVCLFVCLPLQQILCIQNIYTPPRKIPRATEPLIPAPLRSLPHRRCSCWHLHLHSHQPTPRDHPRSAAHHPTLFPRLAAFPAPYQTHKEKPLNNEHARKASNDDNPHAAHQIG